MYDTISYLESGVIGSACHIWAPPTSYNESVQITSKPTLKRRLKQNRIEAMWTGTPWLLSIIKPPNPLLELILNFYSFVWISKPFNRLPSEVVSLSSVRTVTSLLISNCTFISTNFVLFMVIVLLFLVISDKRNEIQRIEVHGLYFDQLK